MKSLLLTDIQPVFHLSSRLWVVDNVWNLVQRLWNSIRDHMTLPVPKNMDGMGLDGTLSQNCRVKGYSGVTGGRCWGPWLSYIGWGGYHPSLPRCKFKGPIWWVNVARPTSECRPVNVNLSSAPYIQNVCQSEWAWATFSHNQVSRKTCSRLSPVRVDESWKSQDKSRAIILN
jgi:hypothetical protein